MQKFMEVIAWLVPVAILAMSGLDWCGLSIEHGNRMLLFAIIFLILSRKKWEL